MFMRKLFSLASLPRSYSLNFSTGKILCDRKENDESERMKKFHRKLDSEVPPDNLLLIEVDPKSGEYIPESEKNPTKWGDWQIGGRVSDF